MEGDRAIELRRITSDIWKGVLGISEVSGSDNFFALGGTSFSWALVMTKLRQSGFSVDAGWIFERPTLEGFSEVLGNRGDRCVGVGQAIDGSEESSDPISGVGSEDIRKISRIIGETKENIQDILPLTSQQYGLFFLYLVKEGGVDAYISSTLVSLPSRHHLTRLISALNALINHHEVLRVAIAWEGLDNPVQVVCRKSAIFIDEVTITDYENIQDDVMRQVEQGELSIDLRRAPLMRLRTVFDSSSGCIYALLQIHHMICDARSKQLMIAEIASLIGHSEVRRSRSSSYRAQVESLVRAASSTDADRYFKNRLGTVFEPTAPFNILETERDGRGAAEVVVNLDAEWVRSARLRVRRMQLSMSTLFHAAWGLVLAHTCGRDDVVFGTVLSGRLQGDRALIDSLGMLINTLPLRLQLKAVTTHQFLRDTQRGIGELVAYEQTCLASALRCSGVRAPLPLFTTLLNYRHRVMTSEAMWATIDGVRYLTRRERTNYPICVSIDDTTASITATVQVAPGIDAPPLARHLVTAIDCLVSDTEETPTMIALALASGRRFINSFCSIQQRA